MITLWNKLSFSTKIVLTVLLVSVVFYAAIAIDLSPILRGPADSILESRWPYYFVNTFSKVWVFIPVYIGFLFVFFLIEKFQKINLRTEWLTLLALVVLTFLFQLALVYFSRFGITVLFRRLVDPGINGYFTEAIRIENIGYLLSHYPDLINDRNFAQHASGHTPGAILLIKWFVDLCSLTPASWISFINNIHPGWAKDLWNNLTLHQKFAAITLPFILHLISSAVIIPFYFVSKELFGNVRSAFRTTILYSVIPSLSFFALIFDPIYALFPLISTLLIMYGIKTKRNNYFFFAGVATGLGLFFTAAILTYVAGLVILVLLSYRKVLVKWMFKFISGIFIVVFGLYLLGFDLINSLIAVISNQASRNYLPWVLYNPYDFFVFMGLPLTLLFIYQTYNLLRNKYKYSLSSLLYAFWIVFIILILSGASRGEVGRIWLPFMFVPVILVGNFINNSVKFSKTQFMIIFTLVFLQTIILEEFWVPIW